MSTTSREITLRLRLLAALVLVTTIALWSAYEGVYGDAVPLASSTVPGVLDVDLAKDALNKAQQNAGQDAYAEAAGTGGFYNQIAAANQSLAQAATEGVTGPSGRQTLQTVIAQIAVYADWVGHAGQVGSTTLLHVGYMHIAQDVLGTPGAKPSDSTVMGRLNALQQAQLRVAHRQTSFGWALWLGWSLSALLVVALVAALVEAHGFVRARFRRRLNRPLLAAVALLVAGSGVLVEFTWRTQRGLARSRARLDQPHTGSGIRATGASVGRLMANTGFRAAAADGIVVGGVLLMVLVGWALWPRIVEYRVKVSR